MREKWNSFLKGIGSHQRAIWIVTAALLLVFPFAVTSNYVLSLATKIILYILFVATMNLLNGYCGMFTVGQAGFIGIGAYVCAILITKLDISFWLALPASGLVAALFGGLISLPVNKLNGLYIAIVTLGFSEVIRIICLNWTPVTGGPLGIKNISRPALFGVVFSSPISMYFLILALTALMFFCTSRVVRSRAGIAWITIRENEQAAQSLGICTWKYKAVCFMYAGFWAGLGGAFMAVYYRYIDSTLFGLNLNFDLLAMTVIGGQGSLLGPIAGVLSINLLSEAFRVVEEYRLAIYSIAIIAMMWARPQGLISHNARWVAGWHGAGARSRTKGGGAA